jgi:non-specific serine/threonine protein kinase
MLETVRDYGYHELHTDGLAQETHLRQATWLAATLQQVEEAWTRAKDRGTILDRADAERANVRVALAWASESGNQELALRLAAAKNFWAVRGGVLEGLRWLTQLVSHSTDVSPRTLALGRTALAGLALNVGDLETARQQFELAKPMWEDLGERRRVAVVLNNLGIVAERLDQLDVARQRTEEALAIMRELDDPIGIAAAVGNLGVLADRLGDLAASVEYNTESLAIARRLNDPLTMSIAASNLGGVALKSGDVARAQGLFEEALRLSQQLDDVEGVIICCEMLAQVALEEGRPDVSAMILGGTARLRGETGFAAAPSQERDLLEITSRTRALLGDASFDELWDHGSKVGTADLAEVAVARDPAARAKGARD